MVRHARHAAASPMVRAAGLPGQLVGGTPRTVCCIRRALRFSLLFSWFFLLFRFLRRTFASFFRPPDPGLRGVFASFFLGAGFSLLFFFGFSLLFHCAVRARGRVCEYVRARVQRSVR